MSVGVAATMRVFGAAGRTTVRAQQQQVAVQQAQAEKVDRLAALPYDELALTSAPSSSSNPLDPGHKVTGSNFAVRSDLTEALVLEPGPGATAEVEPGPDDFAVGTGGGTTVGALHRYVTWRDEDCPLLLCEGQQNTKRLIVAVTLVPLPGTADQVAGVGLEPRRGPRHRGPQVPGTGPAAARGAAIRSRPTRSTSTTLPADRARASPRLAATPPVTRHRRGRTRRTTPLASTRTPTNSRT